MLDRFLRGCPRGFDAQALGYPTSITTCAQAAALVAENLPGSEAIVLIGESFSSPVAVQVAAETGRVSHLVLVGGFVASPGPRWARFLPLRIGFACTKPLLPLAPSAFGSREVAHEVQVALREVPSRVLADRLRSVLTVDVRARLEQVTAPTLYLRGLRDRVVRRRSADDVAAHAKSFTLVEMDATHFMLEQKPDEVWRHIDDFCSDDSGSVSMA